MKRKPPAKLPTALLSPRTEGVLRSGLILILIATLCTIFTLGDCAPLTLAETAHFATIVEYLIVSTALLTAGAYLVERVAREQKEKTK